MNMSYTEDVIKLENQSNDCRIDSSRGRDYDDEPYGEENVLIRASKRRAFLQGTPFGK